MSKKIKLLQDGRDKTLPKVAKIETQLAEGENCYWIPEDEVPLGILQVSMDGVYNAASDPNGPFYGYSEVQVSGVGTREMGQLAEITITKNGTYAANVDQSGPFYGYSKVIVNVPTSGEGGDPTSRPTISGQGADGNDEVVGTDDDGNLVYEKIPSSIRVITAPDNLEYEDGQSILFDGLYVKGYLKDGTEWGVVPNTDLIKPVTVAEFDEEIYVEGGNYATSDLDTSPFTQPIPFGYSFTVELQSGNYTYKSVYEANFPTVIYSESKTLITGSATDSKENAAGTVTYTQINNKTGEIVVNETRNNEPVFNKSYTYNEKSVYYTSGAGGYNNFSSVSVSGIEFVNTGNYLNGPAAWTLIYGNIESSPSGSTQTIPLQWKRPGDKKVLETSFTITVSSSGDNNTSGSTTPGGSNIDVPQ